MTVISLNRERGIMMGMRPFRNLTLLAFVTGCDSLLVQPHIHRPTAAGTRSPAPLLADSAVYIPSRLPTFGLSEREQVRFRYMILSAEPLPHEVFGLQILLGVMGSFSDFCCHEDRLEH